MLSQKLMRIFATQSDGETDPSPIDFFKIIFFKTTMGISKMTEILQTTENSNASSKMLAEIKKSFKFLSRKDLPDCIFCYNIANFDYV